ncbi:hypothetical protein BC831DRAFT_466733 [Entophlyctis helioformis]|nr:hypothetical protein BC831DRAFT_466733 [Entophlyctis helioformis]
MPCMLDKPGILGILGILGKPGSCDALAHGAGPLRLSPVSPRRPSPSDTHPGCISPSAGPTAENGLAIPPPPPTPPTPSKNSWVSVAEMLGSRCRPVNGSSWIPGTVIPPPPPPPTPMPPPPMTSPKSNRVPLMYDAWPPSAWKHGVRSDDEDEEDADSKAEEESDDADEVSGRRPNDGSLNGS